MFTAIFYIPNHSVNSRRLLQTSIFTATVLLLAVLMAPLPTSAQSLTDASRLEAQRALFSELQQVRESQQHMMSTRDYGRLSEIARRIVAISDVFTQLQRSQGSGTSFDISALAVANQEQFNQQYHEESSPADTSSASGATLASVETCVEVSQAALRVAVGIDDMDTVYDFNGDGEVTAEDALNFLRVHDGLLDMTERAARAFARDCSGGTGIEASQVDVSQFTSVDAAWTPEDVVVNDYKLSSHLVRAQNRLNELMGQVRHVVQHVSHEETLEMNDSLNEAQTNLHRARSIELQGSAAMAQSYIRVANRIMDNLTQMLAGIEVPETVSSPADTSSASGATLASVETCVEVSQAALRVAVGIDDMDTVYDFNGDGEVTAEDALNFLRVHDGLLDMTERAARAFTRDCSS